MVRLMPLAKRSCLRSSSKQAGISALRRGPSIRGEKLIASSTMRYLAIFALLVLVSSVFVSKFVWHHRFDAQTNYLANGAGTARGAGAAATQPSPAREPTVPSAPLAEPAIQPAAANSAAAARVAKIGDTLDIVLTNLMGHNEQTPSWDWVREDGCITIVMAGRVQAAGRTPDEIARAIVREEWKYQRLVEAVVTIRSETKP